MPKSGHRGLSITNGWPIVVFWVELSMSGCKSGQQGTLCIRKYRCDYVLPLLLSTGHIAMNEC